MACNSVAGESGSINVCSVEPAESGYLVPEDMLFLPAHGVRSECVLLWFAGYGLYQVITVVRREGEILDMEDL